MMVLRYLSIYLRGKGRSYAEGNIRSRCPDANRTVESGRRSVGFDGRHGCTRKLRLGVHLQQRIALIRKQHLPMF